MYLYRGKRVRVNDKYPIHTAVDREGTVEFVGFMGVENLVAVNLDGGNTHEDRPDLFRTDELEEA